MGKQNPERTDKLFELAKTVVIPIDQELLTGITVERRTLEQFEATAPDLDHSVFDSNKIRMSKDLKARLKDFGKLPARISHSTEFSYYYRHKRRGNPYQQGTAAFYLFELMMKLDSKYKEKDGWFSVAVWVQLAINAKVQKTSKTVPTLLTKVSDLMRMLEYFEVIQINNTDGELRVNPDGPGHA